MTAFVETDKIWERGLLKGFNLLLSLFKRRIQVHWHKMWKYYFSGDGNTFWDSVGIFIASHNQPCVHLARTANKKSGEQEIHKSFSFILGVTQYKSNSGDKTFHAMTSDYLISSPFIFLVFVGIWWKGERQIPQPRTRDKKIQECTTVDTDFIITRTMRFS